ncbi:hypothetical protein A2U94_14875 [Bacillus sp. VT 712]|uniref:Uncharacterized protein n=1 Tax=Priestia flexa TaxID=86664 RepID=A0A8I1MG43_9BACI|nr:MULTISPECIES: hypothetical protein [Bacillaceae]AQX54716.1 hypothetical protein BC359_10625 [Priestia flexa]KZB90643.1 hypothetical protein A2U94_14875 [Bacillus sp. VT 712]MBN8252114.1 hypothetical protein [Priestia flexa]MCG7314648.1 hypothetical protein [Priestia flexa]MDW8516878.1 hypothetical protein [Priestia flexa]
MKKVLLVAFVFICIVGCSLGGKTEVEGQAVFSDEGKEWSAEYIYDHKLYQERKTNWVTLEPKEIQLTPEQLKYITVEIQTSDGDTVTGNVKAMMNKLDDNAVSFLVGTLNDRTCKEDVFKMKIIYKNEEEVLNLKMAEDE